MALVLAIAASGGLCERAVAQTNTPKKQQVRLISGNWTLGCQPNSKNSELMCQATQTIKVENSGQVIAGLTVARWGQDYATAPYVLRTQLPHGVNIPAGVAIEIDGNAPHQLVIRTSAKGGLFATIGLSEELLTGMKRGRMLNINFKALNGEKLVIPASLNGFTAVFNKLK